MSLTKQALFSVIAQNMPYILHHPDKVKGLEDKGEKYQRNLLGDLLISADIQWNEDVLQLVDALYEAEAKNQILFSLKDLAVSKTNDKFHGTQISLFRGDITTLQVDAIVNAANDQGMGCYQPNHRCIDNIIHRRAGPRLRMECRKLMEKRLSSPLLSAGSPPIVSSGYHLPSNHVIHVTGPQIARGERVTDRHRNLLRKTYANILDTAVYNGLKTIAIPCISTGLFGFPADEAARIAATTVKQWLGDHPSSQIDSIVFDVFSSSDEYLYRKELGHTFHMFFDDVGDDKTQPPVVGKGSRLHARNETKTKNPRDLALQVAKHYLDQADAILIVAGAGMSAKEGEMVYTNPNDFAKHYPFFPRWGYRTSYEVMGLGSDPSVPDTAKWGLHAKHMDNMRWRFTPNEGYDQLLRMVRSKDYFVLTSNVDACFERSGFDPNRIYTPQGEWTYLQCMKPCRRDSVVESRPYLDRLLPEIGGDGLVPKKLVPKCPRCGSKMFGNVRGGSWFLHHKKYQKQNELLQKWMESLVRDPMQEHKVLVLEIGAGFNTPMITRFPAEAFARALGPDRGMFVRINPSDEKVPADLKAVSLAEGWQVLSEIDGQRPLPLVDEDTSHASSAMTDIGSGAEAGSVAVIRAKEDELARYQEANGAVSPLKRRSMSPATLVISTGPPS